MRFYLGTHRPNWLGFQQLADVPLFVSHLRLKDRKSFPRAVGSWALDSGGFTEVSRHGHYRDTPSEYVAAVRRYSEHIGAPDFCAPQDWMCEPFVLAKTGLTVEEHQRRTINNLLELRSLAPDLPFIPVLQGWAQGDYLRHMDDYERAGIDLAAEPLVGVGGVCRRQNTSEIHWLVRAIAERGVSIHGFGVKKAGFAAAGYLLSSGDSMAWSFVGRRFGRLPGCDHRGPCNNCLRFALRWRDELLAILNTQQLHLEGVA